MLVQYISDIHLEFLHNQRVKALAERITAVAPILVLAGDIGIPHHLDNHYEIFLDIISPKFQKVFIIAGNHEFYTCYPMNDVIEKINRICAKYSNVSFLNNSYEDYMGYRWIGSTLWSRVDEKTTYLINDTEYIAGMTPAYYNQLHTSCSSFLEKTLAEIPIGLKCIIITHHLPSPSLIDAEYLTPEKQPYNQWFAANMDNLIVFNMEKISTWFYGHTHKPRIYNLDGVQFVCNPLGYPNENRVYNLTKTVEL